MEVTALKDLSPDSFRAKIKVRFARVWEFRSPDKTALYTVDFVVVDGQVRSSYFIFRFHILFTRILHIYLPIFIALNALYSTLFAT
jgi:hypothetical protein